MERRASARRRSTELRGRIVFIGLTAVALGDRVKTPVSRDAEAGVTVQAASAESVLRGEEIRGRNILDRHPERLEDRDFVRRRSAGNSSENDFSQFSRHVLVADHTLLHRQEDVASFCKRAGA